MPRVDGGVRRYDSLDAWRGVACLFVVLGHCTVYMIPYASPESREQQAANAILALLKWMVVGVPMFFVISGYCITAAAYNAQSRSHSFASFMYRRARRIYPPYFWLVVLTVLVVCATWALGAPRLFSDDHFPIVHPFSMTWDQWLGNLTLTETWRSHVFGAKTQFFMGHIWTLCYEEQFYLTTGVCLLVFGRRLSIGLALLTVFTLCVIGLKLRVNGFFFDGHWLMFAAGCAVFYSAHLSQRTGRIILVMLLAGSAAGTLLLRSPRWYFFSEFAEAPIFALLLIGLLKYDQAILRSAPGRWLAWVGRMCYSLYLIHLPITKATSHVFSTLGFDQGWGALCLNVFTGTAASLLAGYLFHRTIEQRFLNSRLRAGSERTVRRANEEQSPGGLLGTRIGAEDPAPVLGR